MQANPTQQISCTQVMVSTVAATFTRCVCYVELRHLRLAFPKDNWVVCVCLTTQLNHSCILQLSRSGLHSLQLVIIGCRSITNLVTSTKQMSGKAVSSLLRVHHFCQNFTKYNTVRCRLTVYCCSHHSSYDNCTGLLCLQLAQAGKHFTNDYCYRLQTQHVEVAIGHSVRAFEQPSSTFMICSCRYTPSHPTFKTQSLSAWWDGGESCNGVVKVCILRQCQYPEHIMQDKVHIMHSAAWVLVQLQPFSALYFYKVSTSSNHIQLDIFKFAPRGTASYVTCLHLACQIVLLHSFAVLTLF